MALVVNRVKRFNTCEFSQSLHLTTTYHLGTKIIARTYSTSPKRPDSIIQIPEKAKKVNSVVLPLGSQKVYVPSPRLAKIWDKKMHLIQQYLALPSIEKELKLLDLSLKKYYFAMHTSFPQIQNRDDLEKVFIFITETARIHQITPSIIYDPGNPGEIDLW